MKNGLKYGGIMGCRPDPQSRPAGQGLIAPAINANLYQDLPNTRTPVGRATGPNAGMTMPPASFSINTTPGAPRRSARGNQYK